MISERMKRMTQNSSAIRAMFEEGNRLASIYGRENVYDFSLGNPNFPAPAAVNEAIIEVAKEKDTCAVHGYMPNSGFPDVRRAVAENLNSRFGTDYNEGGILMTVGAAGGLNCVLQTLLNPNEEILVFAPYFLEYGNYVANWGGVLKVISPSIPDFQPSAKALADALTPNTKALLLNNPNNPTGVIYTEETIRSLAKVLEDKSAEYGHPIYLISDEPYRELAFGGVKVPFIPNLYKNTIVVYSWSKSLSLPGERLGYIAIRPGCEDASLLFDALCISNRIIGFVNAPSVMQKAVAKCLACSADIGAYEANRNLLCSILDDCGFTYVKPDGAFYLWLKTPVDDKEFSAAAKEFHILLVPGSSFACAGYVRIAYCVSPEQIKRSADAFAQLAKRFGLI